MESGRCCEGLSTGYDRRAGPQVTGVSLRFAPGRFTALLGPNGCGKSTLLRALMGFLPTWEGQASLDGKSVATIPRKAMARRVAWLPQESHCPDYLTVGELLELGVHAQAGRFGFGGGLLSERAEAVLAEVGLTGMGAAQVNRLSGGQRQRAFIAMVLAQDAEILLLDEPVNHLDIRYQYEIMALVQSLMNRRGRTVIAVLHDRNLAGAFADDIALMRDGRLIAHAPTADILTKARIEEIYGIRGEILVRGKRLFFMPEIPGKETAPNNIRTFR